MFVNSSRTSHGFFYHAQIDFKGRNLSHKGSLLFKGCLAVLFAYTKECFIDNNLRIRMSFLDPDHKIPKNVVHSRTVMCTGIL